MRRVFVLMLLGACTNARVESGQGATSAVPQAAADSAVGRVQVVGADPATWLSLQPAGGGTSLRLEGQVEPLRAVSGADVMVSGQRNGGVFMASAFVVRRVNDRPVDDGVVFISNGRVILRLRSGTEREVPHAPDALRALAGSRVWVSLPVAGVSPSFGVIER